MVAGSPVRIACTKIVVLGYRLAIGGSRAIYLYETNTKPYSIMLSSSSCIVDNSTMQGVQLDYQHSPPPFECIVGYANVVEVLIF